MIFTAYSDGGCRKATNVSGWAAVILNEVLGSKVTIAEAAPYRTNNEAEYLGLLTALKYSVEHGAEVLDMRMDSELVVRQINGAYTVRAPKMRTFWQEATKLIAMIPKFSIKHVYRELNTEADAAVNAAMEERLKNCREV